MSPCLCTVYENREPRHIDRRSECKVLQFQKREQQRNQWQTRCHLILGCHQRLAPWRTGPARSINASLLRTDDERRRASTSHRLTQQTRAVKILPRSFTRFFQELTLPVETVLYRVYNTIIQLRDSLLYRPPQGRLTAVKRRHSSPE